MKRWIKLAGFLIGLVATVAFIAYARTALQGQDLAVYTTPSAVQGLLWCTLLYIASVPLAAWAWQKLLHWQGIDKPVSVLTALMAVSQLGKYAPGNVGAHLGRAVMGSSLGIALKPLASTMVVEAVLVAYTALTVGVVCWAGLAWSHTMLPLCLALLLLLAPLVFPRHILPARWSPPAAALLACCAAYTLVYVLVALGVWSLAWQLLPQSAPSWLVLCAAFALSWIAGYFTPGAPAGMGVREVAMFEIIRTHSDLPTASVLLLVIGFRLATVAGDALLFLLGSLGWWFRSPRPQPSSLVCEPAMTTPAMTLEPTGERMIVEHYRATREDHVIYIMHDATYRFAEPFVAGKRVLDYGCGSGYGSAKMSALAASVVGVDVASDAIDHARQNFQSPNLDFQVIDPNAALPFAEGAFDTVLSFQVFEHVADTARYLTEINRVLAPGGTLILATPDRSTRLLPFQQPWNRWHLREYAAHELQGLLFQHFPQVQMLGMGGAPEVIGVEIDRCRKVKWLTLPFTLPGIPHALRVKLLNLLHRLRGAPRTGTPIDCLFSIDDIIIAPAITPSVNLIAIATSAVNVQTPPAIATSAVGEIHTQEPPADHQATARSASPFSSRRLP